MRKFLRKLHCFSDLNRKFKHGSTSDEQFLEAIKTQFESPSQEFSEDELEFVFLEMISIANNPTTVITNKLTEYFEKIMIYIVQKCTSKQNFVRFSPLGSKEVDSYRYKELYTPIIEWLEKQTKQSLVPIDQLVHFYWSFDLILEGDHRASLALNLLLKNCDEVICLLRNPNICYFILGVFKMTIEALEEIETSKFSTAFYQIYKTTGEAWVRDEIKNVFKFFYDEKTFLTQSDKSLELLMLICIFVRMDNKNGPRQAELKCVQTNVMTAIENGNAFKHHNSAKVYSDFVTTVNLTFPSVISVIERGLNYELSDQSRANYIKGLAGMISVANEKLNAPEVLKATAIFSRNMASQNSLVSDTCVESFSEFASVIPYEGFLLALLRLPNEKLSCQHFEVLAKTLKLSKSRSASTCLQNVIAEVFLNNLKYENIETHEVYDVKSKKFHEQNVYDLIDAVDFDVLKNLILEPLNNFEFLEYKGNISNFGIVLRAAFNRHNAFLSNENKSFLCECVLTALKFEIRIHNSVSTSILICCKDIDMDFFEVKILPVLCLADSSILFDREFIEFTSKTYSNLKSLKPLLKNKFLQVLCSSDYSNDYSEFLKILDHKEIIENELLPKMMSFSDKELIKFCHNSFSASFKNLTNHCRVKLKEKLSSIMEKTSFEIGFPVLISLMDSYELKGRAISKRLSESFEKMLSNNKSFEQIDSNLYQWIGKYIDDLKKTAESKFESLIGSYKPKHNEVCTFLWEIICRNRTKIDEFKRLRIITQRTDFEYEARRIYQKTHNHKKKSPPIAIIFHNDDWPDHPFLMKRNGSEKDIDQLKKTFELLSISTLVVQNPTFAKIENVLQRLIKFDFEDISALIIGISTLGAANDLVLAKDYSYQITSNILNPLINGNSKLKDIPIFMFIQSSFADDEIPFPGYTELELNTKPVQASQLLRLNSTLDGFHAFRNSEMGTPFIRALCAVFKEKGDDALLRDIAQDVKRELQRLMREDDQAKAHCGDKFEQYANESGTFSSDLILGHYTFKDELWCPNSESIENFFEHLKLMKDATSSQFC